jgi:UDP-N-acetylmuramate dehydrogenase
MIKIQKNVCLAEYTTFRIGGRARYFFKAKTKEDLIRAVDFAKGKDLPFFILGGGSNLLVGDDGFDGLVILMDNKKLEINGNRIITEAGLRLSDLIKFSIKNNLTGLEWAIGIPGTVGGAIRVKASAYGQNISELVKKTETRDDIILSVVLELNKGDKEKSKKLIKEYIKKRRDSQPLNCPSAGCIFKNPLGQYAGQLIDRAGLKGTKIGQAMISDKHANFIVNLGGAQAKDVVELIRLIKKTIKEKFNLDLKEEIQYLGF